MTIDTISFSEEVLDQASAWIVRLRSDQVTEQDQQDFALWLAESDQHQNAFDEMMVLWEAMGSSHSQQSAISALLGKVSTDNGPTASNDCVVTDDSLEQKKPRRFRLFPMAALTGLAASVLIVGLLFFSGTPSILHDISPAQTLYATPIGTQQRFALEDGSFLELNTDSQVAVSYTDDTRKLILIKGEAYFDVEPDKSRPFIVAAGAGQVTAVGTAFNIQLSPGGNSIGNMIVAVSEGRVAVANREALDSVSSAIEVEMGRQTKVNKQGFVGVVETSDLQVVSAWREKTLIFRGTDLATALAELNRYLANPVDTSDPSLGNLNVSGTFSLEEPEATLGAIIKAFKLQSYKNPFDNKTRLYLR